MRTVQEIFDYAVASDDNLLRFMVIVSADKIRKHCNDYRIQINGTDTDALLKGVKSSLARPDEFQYIMNVKPDTSKMTDEAAEAWARLAPTYMPRIWQIVRQEEAVKINNLNEAAQAIFAAKTRMQHAYQCAPVIQNNPSHKPTEHVTITSQMSTDEMMKAFIHNCSVNLKLKYAKQYMVPSTAYHRDIGICLMKNPNTDLREIEICRFMEHNHVAQYLPSYRSHGHYDFI